MSASASILAPRRDESQAVPDGLIINEPQQYQGGPILKWMDLREAHYFAVQ